MTHAIKLAGVSIGPLHPPVVVAELSGNHNGDLGRARDIVRAVADAGAQVLKLQTYTADTITIDVDRPEFRVSGSHTLWGNRTLHQLYEEAHTPWEWHEPLFELARDVGLVPFSSPFDPTAIDFLEDLGAPAYKVASSEIVDLPLVRRMAETGKPVIVSTGMASLSEIDRAVSVIRSTGNQDVIVLSATTSYPAVPKGSNLRAITRLRDMLSVQVGLSDHTHGIGTAVAAVALGATVIEKHVTLARAHGGVDAQFSSEPDELAQLVRETRSAWEALGDPVIGPKATEAEGLRFRRSLYVVHDVKAGEAVTRGNVRSIRPSGGLPPDMIDAVLGRAFTRDVERGTAFTWDLV